MGTTLTGTTPQDTYDSLIKVTDNGPIGATPKYVSDGLGTDSSLALSTKNILIGTTTAVVNYGRELTVDATALTSEPEAFLALKGNRVSGNIAAVPFYNGAQQVGSITMQAEGNMRLLTGTTTANTSEKVRITSTGNVGIGTSSPDIFGRFYTRSVGIDSSGISKIQINGTTYSGIDLGSGGTRRAEINADAAGVDIATIGSIPLRLYTNGVNRISVTDNGLTFNGDTAAANALDDYEEGTWTMAAAPTASGTITLDGAVNAGSYTKIGRQVTVTGLAEVSAVSSPVGTSVAISGLPFPIAARALDYDSRIGGSVTVASGGTVLPRAIVATEGNSSFSIFVDASTISAGNSIYISFTYIA
jgi:hypothetical protein